MVAVTFTANGCVNNIKFRKYILRHELFIKHITDTFETDTFEYKNFFCHPPGVNMGFVKEALRLLRTNSSCSKFKNVQSFLIFLKNRGYFYQGCKKHISKVIFCRREKTTDAHRRKFILPFVIKFHPTLLNL